MIRLDVKILFQVGIRLALNRSVHRLSTIDTSLTCQVGLLRDTRQDFCRLGLRDDLGLADLALLFVDLSVDQLIVNSLLLRLHTLTRYSCLLSA